MDFAEAHNDLKTLAVNQKLDFQALFERFGPIRIYSAWGQFYPQGFKDKVTAAGHQLIALKASEYPDPIINYIVQDIWQSDELYDSFVIITPSPSILPVAKALQAIGKNVTLVSCSNATRFSKEGLNHSWLHRAA
jgi:hypothetical protein